MLKPHEEQEGRITGKNIWNTGLSGVSKLAKATTHCILNTIEGIENILLQVSHQKERLTNNEDYSTLKKVLTPIWNGLLDALHKAGVTPNNVVTFRIFLLFVGLVLYIAGEQGLAATSIFTSLAGDGADGALARKYNQKSKVGELYDAQTDKVSDLVISGIIFHLLWQVYPELAIIFGGIASGKLYQHHQSAIRPGRPGYREQGPMFLQAAFKDELTQYVEEKTGGAANNYGKIKTAVQMISNGVMLGILTVSDAYGMIDTLLLSIGVIAQGGSIGLGYLSNYPPKDLKIELQLTAGMVLGRIKNILRTKLLIPSSGRTKKIYRIS